MRRSRKVYLIGGIIIWFIALIIIFNKQISLETNDGDHVRIERALNEISELRKQNQELHDIISTVRKLQFGNMSHEKTNVKNLRLQLAACKRNNGCKNKPCEELSKEHEVLVRRSKNNAIELQYAFERSLEEFKNNPTDLDKIINLVKSRYTTQLQAAFLDVEDLQRLNNEWRQKEARDLTELIRTRIDYIQNPKDCDNAKKLVCNLNKACGFGCQLHHLAYCFMVAYGTERTLIIESKNWRYNPEGWEAVFLPVSKTCTQNTGGAKPWRGEEASRNARAVLLPIVDSLSNPPSYLPLGFPEDIGQRLLRLHGNPSVWWVGQFVSFLLRPQQWLEEDVEATVKKSGFENPCVGVHVRRTDKIGTEAAFHGIEEYMKHVEAWYDRLDLRLSKDKSAHKAVRRVYLASDDASVLPEARKKYPGYVFYGDTKIAESAGLRSRYSKNSLRGVLIDIYMLSKCDFLSCTFSSQICRSAYELMQSLHPDASDFFHSLDDIYYYGGQTGHDQRAVFPHQGGGGEISLQVGDVVGIAGNHWDGYSKGINKRTRQVGLYPSYKADEIFRLVKYPSYQEASRKN